MTHTAEILVQRDGVIATITLNRPDAHNAYSEDMVAALVEAIRDCDHDPQVRAIVLTGAGKSFCAGGDLKRMRDREGMFAGDSVALRRAYERGIQTIPRALAACETPVIAAINGAAIGAGLDLACMCDLRICADTAKLGSTFVKVGLVPGDGGALFLARVIGFPRALEMVLTGRTIDAQRAATLDLVHEVVPPDEVVPRAQQVAREIAANAPLAVQLAKRAAYRSRNENLELALELAASFQGMVQRTDDHVEAVRAILEKRAPEFKGE